jgi:hypothetical protein
MTCRRPSAKDVNQRSPSRLVDAQNAQIWTASVVIGIEPKSTQIGGSVRVLRDIPCHSAWRRGRAWTCWEAAPCCAPATGNALAGSAATFREA